MWREDTVPDKSTILRVRHRLAAHQLTVQLFEAVRTLRTDKRLLLKAGTIVDATIIVAPSSTKHATRTRDPVMPQTRTGQQWDVGRKIHVDSATRGIVHSLPTTDAAQADSTPLAHLVHGEESTRSGDEAYSKADDNLHWEAGWGRSRVTKRRKRTPRTA